MKTRNKLLLLACATFSIMSLVKSQNQQGFISLHCGLPSNESYIEPSTNLTYISDVNFIRGGKTGNIQNNSRTNFIFKPLKILRYFPDGIRNCYSLSVKQGTKYLIRTVFSYGNYDGLNISPRFDLFLGPNIWTSVDVLKAGVGDGVVEEIIHVAMSNILDICLVKTGTSTPMISAIELRPLRYDTYTARTGSLKLIAHLYFTNSDEAIRYPEDVYDRVWIPYSQPEWTQINTTRNVSGFSDGYNPPQGVIKTASIPTNVSEPLTFTWNLESSDDESYAYLYFAEIQQLKVNETREFKILANGVDYIPYIPLKFEAKTLSNPAPLKCEGGVCRVQLLKTPKSNLPPLMNAIEIFSVIQFPQSETNTDDVIAIKNIQSTYQLSRISWQGDPCVPKQFSWIGVSCNVIDISTPSRIIALDLSSSGLTGVIPPSLQNLTLLRELDLSNNNLTGEVPEFLANIKSLLVIHLRGNNLRGSVPQAFQDRERNDGLKLFVDPNIKRHGQHQPKSRLVAIVASISCVTVTIIVLVLVFIFRRRKSSTRKGKRGGSVLNWSTRLKIAIESTLGL
ncbi:unnamed protein product [Arabidopsis arenosa]|uniref:Malectin-like domain-containing protein n=1 Tax=Arabidopsis arenosa TaxID=38785 RepID=A0A8S2A3D2_ARAAE|nr:unnamed protein product [Arabidopsis arenosa]